MAQGDSLSSACRKVGIYESAAHKIMKRAKPMKVPYGRKDDVVMETVELTPAEEKEDRQPIEAQVVQEARIKADGSKGKVVILMGDGDSIESMLDVVQVFLAQR